MTESFDRINERAEELIRAEHEEQGLRRYAQERASRQWEQDAQAVQEQRMRVAELCGKFTKWASANDIPYNSPAPFARGWILGRGEGPPSYHISHQGVEDTGMSTYALLLKSSGSMREIILNNVRRSGRYRGSYLAKPAKLERYTIPSIEESIAEFSVEHRTPWRTH